MHEPQTQLQSELYVCHISSCPYTPLPSLSPCLTSECTRDESGRLPVCLFVCLCNIFDVRPIVVWQHVVSKHLPDLSLSLSLCRCLCLCHSLYFSQSFPFDVAPCVPRGQVKSWDNSLVSPRCCIIYATLLVYWCLSVCLTVSLYTRLSLFASAVFALPCYLSLCGFH